MGQSSIVFRISFVQALVLATLTMRKWTIAALFGSQLSQLSLGQEAYSVNEAGVTAYIAAFDYDFCTTSGLVSGTTGSGSAIGSTTGSSTGVSTGTGSSTVTLGSSSTTTGGGSPT